MTQEERGSTEETLRAQALEPAPLDFNADSTIYYVVTWSQFFNVSKSQFYHLQNGNDNSPACYCQDCERTVAPPGVRWWLSVILGKLLTSLGFSYLQLERVATSGLCSSLSRGP